MCKLAAKAARSYEMTESHAQQLEAHYWELGWGTSHGRAGAVWPMEWGVGLRSSRGSGWLRRQQVGGRARGGWGGLPR